MSLFQVRIICKFKNILCGLKKNAQIPIEFVVTVYFVSLAKKFSVKLFCIIDDCEQFQ